MFELVKMTAVNRQGEKIIFINPSSIAYVTEHDGTPLVDANATIVLANGNEIRVVHDVETVLRALGWTEGYGWAGMPG